MIDSMEKYVRDVYKPYKKIHNKLNSIEYELFDNTREIQNLKLKVIKRDTTILNYREIIDNKIIVNKTNQKIIAEKNIIISHLRKQLEERDKKISSIKKLIADL